MKPLTSLIFAILIIAAVACGDEQATEYTQENDEKILTIKHRLFRGECLGYCDTDLILDSTHVTYIKRGWDTSSMSFPVIDTSFQISKMQWNSIVSIININSIIELDSLYLLDDNGGGVSEGVIYFEIITTQRHKKIIFPNRKYLEPVDSLNKKLIDFRMGI